MFNSVCINMMRAMICLIVSLFIWLVSGGATTTFAGHIVIFISSIGMAVNLLTWILATQLAPLILVDSLCLIGSMVVPMILAPYIYGGETVSPLQWLSCALVVVAFLFFLGKDTAEKQKCPLFKKIIILFGCAAGITVSTVFKKYYIVHFTSHNNGSVEYFTFISFVTAVILLGIMFTVFYINESRALARENSRAKPSLPYKKVGWYIIIAGVALYVNEIFTGYAQGDLPTAVYFPIAKGVSVLSTFGIDVILFHCKISWKKIIGLISLLAAIVLANF